MSTVARLSSGWRPAETGFRDLLLSTQHSLGEHSGCKQIESLEINEHSARHKLLLLAGHEALTYWLLRPASPVEPACPACECVCPAAIELPCPLPKVERAPGGSPWHSVLQAVGAGVAGQLVGTLMPGSRLPAWCADDSVWHERLAAWPISGPHWVLQTPDKDLYPEYLDGSDPEGLERAIPLLVDGRLPRLGAQAYRFPQPPTEGELKGVIRVKASAASKHNLHSGSGVASSSKRGRSYQKRKHTSSFLADQASTREWSAWKLAAAGHKGRGMSLAEADHSFEPEEIASERTEAGTFRVFRFPLSFSSTALYWRRFGVDVPRECEREGSSCPVLFDFHGSYDSLYTQRNWTKWYQYQAQVSPEKQFILVTPEGSPDAVTYFEAKLNDDASDGAYSVGSSATSWNVLGWGDPSPAVPDDAICAEVPGNWQCFEKTLTEENAYPCYGTHLESLPYLCAPYNDTVLQSPDNRIDPAHQMYARTNCTSSGRANDWDYMKTVVQFVVQQFRADKTRIYFSGQSMGGMATLQFAVAEGKYALPKDLQPAAIAPCSPPGSRMNQLELFGKEALYVASPIRLAQAMKVAGITNVSDIPSDIPHFLLYVDVLTGGAFLSEVVRRLYESQRVGCLDSKGNVMPLSYSGIMGEGLNTTLSRIVGKVLHDLIYEDFFQGGTL
ncbi:unnamed protein product, partial [Prorocentrum cordatum]